MIDNVAECPGLHGSQQTASVVVVPRRKINVCLVEVVQSKEYASEK